MLSVPVHCLYCVYVCGWMAFRLDFAVTAWIQCLVLKIWQKTNFLGLHYSSAGRYFYFNVKWNELCYMKHFLALLIPMRISDITWGDQIAQPPPQPQKALYNFSSYTQIYSPRPVNTLWSTSSPLMQLQGTWAWLKFQWENKCNLRSLVIGRRLTFILPCFVGKSRTK